MCPVGGIGMRSIRCQEVTSELFSKLPEVNLKDEIYCLHDIICHSTYIDLTYNVSGESVDREGTCSTK